MSQVTDYVKEEQFIEELENAEGVMIDGAYTEEWSIQLATIEFIVNGATWMVRRDHLAFAKWREGMHHATGIECPTLCKKVDIILM